MMHIPAVVSHVVGGVGPRFLCVDPRAGTVKLEDSHISIESVMDKIGQIIITHCKKPT